LCLIEKAVTAVKAEEGGSKFVDQSDAANVTLQMEDKN
jgi:hypothetical protein